LNKIQKLFFILPCLFLLISCSGNSPETDEPAQPVPSKEQEPEQSQAAEKEIIPLRMKENDFIRVIDWIDSERVLILSKAVGENQLLEYNIFSGDQKVLYTDTEFVVDVFMGPDRKKILVHTAPLTYSASATVIDLNGEVLFQKEIDSYEVAFEWSEKNTDLLFITSFSEDWSFATMLADISENTLTAVESPQPFIKWHLENSFLYQAWPEESISLTAPLYSQNLFSEDKVLVEEDTVHFDSLDPYVLSVSMADEPDGTGIYAFISKEGTIVSTFAQPLLSGYSNWLIPYYDKIDSEDVFVSLSASETVPADTYQGTFTLERWDIESGNREEIMPGLENEPLQCSPAGEYCLTGFELKTVVNLNTKEAADLIIIE
jgi:hypothetical protein